MTRMTDLKSVISGPVLVSLQAPHFWAPSLVGEQVPTWSATPPNRPESRIRCKRLNPREIGRSRDNQKERNGTSLFGSDAWLLGERLTLGLLLSSERRFLPGMQDLK